MLENIADVVVATFTNWKYEFCTGMYFIRSGYSGGLRSKWLRNLGSIPGSVQIGYGAPLSLLLSEYRELLPRG
jgi:hypothetical protein